MTDYRVGPGNTQIVIESLQKKDNSMSTTEHFTSLDETLLSIKQAHAEELRTLKDKLLAVQIEADLSRIAAAEANRERDTYMRLATKLITQFGTVEQVFATAKQMALEYAMADQKWAKPPPPDRKSPEQIAEERATAVDARMAQFDEPMEAKDCPPTPEEIAAKVQAALENPK